MRVVRRSSRGGHPTPGRGQAIAPTMDEPGKALRRHSGRPAGMLIRLPSLDQPMEQSVGINGAVGWTGITVGVDELSVQYISRQSCQT